MENKKVSHPYFEQLPVYKGKPKFRTVYPDRHYSYTEVIMNARRELNMPENMCQIHEYQLQKV